MALDIHDSSVKKRFTSKVQQCIAGALRCDACSHIPRAVLDITYCGAANRLRIRTSPVDAQDEQIKARDVMLRHSVSAIGAEQAEAQAQVEVAQSQDIYECAMASLQGFHEKARIDISQTSTYVRAKTSDLSVKAHELLGEESVSKVQESAAVIGERAHAVGASFWSGLRGLHQAGCSS